MATKAAKRPRNVTGRRKTPAKKPASKTVKGEASAESNGKPAIKKAKGNAAVDPNQPNLPIVEDDRIPAIETILKKRVKNLAEINRLQEAVKADVGRLPDLFKKHKLLQYSGSGLKVTVTHGADEVKFKKAKA